MRRLAAVLLTVPTATPPTDSAFAGVQERGKVVMGVDQYTSQHVFEDLSDGGRIVLARDPSDTAGTRVIRAHLSFQRTDHRVPERQR